jgi:hypothetical protein
MKKKVRIFISYAHRNQQLASEFSSKFVEYISASKRYEYEVWRDVELLVGQDWNEQIQKYLKECHVGILLISPSFLNSNYIKMDELPTILSSGKVILPVGLSHVDFERHDLLGLEKYQIFRLSSDAFLEPRFYEKLKLKRRNEFIENLFTQLEKRLDDSNL